MMAQTLYLTKHSKIVVTGATYALYWKVRGIWQLRRRGHYVRNMGCTSQTVGLGTPKELC